VHAKLENLRRHPGHGTTITRPSHIITHHTTSTRSPRRKTQAAGTSSPPYRKKHRDVYSNNFLQSMSRVLEYTSDRGQQRTLSCRIVTRSLPRARSTFQKPVGEGVRVSWTHHGHTFSKGVPILKLYGLYRMKKATCTRTTFCSRCHGYSSTRVIEYLLFID
jgi:hypothetical protein